MTQCFCNVLICSVMMAWKQINPKAFQGLENIGMRVSTFTEAMAKLNIGLRMGLMNLVTVFFGIFSVKLVSIPL